MVRPSAGRVLVRGVDVADLDPAPLRRSIGYVMQSVGLFPHRTVAENLANPTIHLLTADQVAAADIKPPVVYLLHVSDGFLVLPLGQRVDRPELLAPLAEPLDPGRERLALLGGKSLHGRLRLEAEAA